MDFPCRGDGGRSDRSEFQYQARVGGTHVCLERLTQFAEPVMANTQCEISVEIVLDAEARADVVAVIVRDAMPYLVGRGNHAGFLSDIGAYETQLANQ